MLPVEFSQYELGGTSVLFSTLLKELPLSVEKLLSVAAAEAVSSGSCAVKILLQRQQITSRPIQDGPPANF